MVKRLKSIKKKTPAGPPILKLIFWVVGVAVFLFIVLLVAASVYISVNYSPEKLKTIAINKLSETFKRKVVIGGVRFNVLTGFEITDLHIANRAGWTDQDFVIDKDILISYHLWPLFFGKFDLGEITLNEPQIFVESRGQSQSNISDILSGISTAVMAPKESSSFSFVDSADAAVPPVAASNAVQSGKSDLLFTVGTIAVFHGKLVYLDETATPTQRSELDDLNIQLKNISMTGGKTTFILNTPVQYNKESHQLALNGSCGYSLAGQSIKALSVKGTWDGGVFVVSGDEVDFLPHGQAALKNVGLSLGNEPYFQNLNSVVEFSPALIKAQNTTFNAFDGSGVVSFLLTQGKTPGYFIAIDLKNVNTGKTVNTNVDAYAAKSAANYKDKFDGKLNLIFKGTYQGTTAAEKMSSLNASGSYSISSGTIKGYPLITFLCSFFKDKGNAIVVDTISGNFNAKNSVLAFTAVGNGKMGQVRANGAINMVTQYYAPDMKVQCDIHKDFLDSNAIKAQLPDNIKDKFDINLLADSNGNVPLDFHFTGDPLKLNSNCFDISRLGNVFLNNYVNQMSSKGQNILQGLFGH